MGYGAIKSAAMCIPEEEYFSVHNFALHNFASIINKEKAIKQFNRLKETLIRLGVKVQQVKELGGHPNSVFTRDTAVVLKEGFIKLRMGLSSRRGEESWMANFLQSLGIPEIAEVKVPLTAEGGDVVVGDGFAFIGVSSRTNREGAQFVSSILEKLNYQTEIIEFSGPYLHLGGAVSLVGTNSVLYCKEAIPESVVRKYGLNLMPIECNEFIGGNVIGVDERNVIVSKNNTIATEALVESDFAVHLLDLSEFVKGNGGPSCMVLPINY